MVFSLSRRHNMLNNAAIILGAGLECTEKSDGIFDSVIRKVHTMCKRAASWINFLVQKSKIAVRCVDDNQKKKSWTSEFEFDTCLRGLASWFSPKKIFNQFGHAWSDMLDCQQFICRRQCLVLVWEYVFSLFSVGTELLKYVVSWQDNADGVGIWHGVLS